MDVAEQMVERFITSNGRAFVCSQFDLKSVEVWGANGRASLDFVVLDFEERQVVAVEVCEGGGLGSVETKARSFQSEGYGQMLAAQVSELTNGVTDGWKVSFLGFVSTEELAAKAREKFGNNEMHFRPLSDTMADRWKQREHLLPPKQAVTRS